MREQLVALKYHADTLSDLSDVLRKLTVFIYLFIMEKNLSGSDILQSVYGSEKCALTAARRTLQSFDIPVILYDLI